MYSTLDYQIEPASAGQAGWYVKDPRGLIVAYCLTRAGAVALARDMAREDLASLRDESPDAEWVGEPSQYIG